MDAFDSKGIINTLKRYYVSHGILQLKSDKNCINDISGNIKTVFLKLGTMNVHHKRNKLHPNCCCHSNSFGFSLFPSKTKYPNLQPPK